MCIHTKIHSHTHTYVIYIHTHTCMCVCMDLFVCHTYIYRILNIYVHVCTYNNTLPYTYICIRMDLFCYGYCVTSQGSLDWFEVDRRETNIHEQIKFVTHTYAWISLCVSYMYALISLCVPCIHA